MPRKEYSWSIDDPPEIAPHSLAKHRILREYVEEYVRVLTADPRTDKLRLNLVDGFAGGGVYVDPRSGLSQAGSPVVLLDAVQVAEAAANVNRAKPLHVDARYFFVDRDSSAIACLRETLRRRSTWATEQAFVQVVEGEFDSQLDRIIQAIKSRGRAWRSIFVLDQYGYTAAPPGLLRRIFDNLPNAEVFLTVAVGWVAAYLADLKTAAAKLGIPQDVLDRVAACGDEGPAIDDVDLRPTLQRLQVLLKEAFTTGIGSTYSSGVGGAGGTSGRGGTSGAGGASGRGGTSGAGGTSAAKCSMKTGECKSADDCTCGASCGVVAVCTSCTKRYNFYCDTDADCVKRTSHLTTPRTSCNQTSSYGIKVCQ